MYIVSFVIARLITFFMSTILGVLGFAYHLEVRKIMLLAILPSLLEAT
jgi:hypothetical protein